MGFFKKHLNSFWNNMDNAVSDKWYVGLLATIVMLCLFLGTVFLATWGMWLIGFGNSFVILFSAALIRVIYAGVTGK
jgi:hypothetical protein